MAFDWNKLALRHQAQLTDEAEEWMVPALLDLNERLEKLEPVVDAARKLERATRWKPYDDGGPEYDGTRVNSAESNEAQNELFEALCGLQGDDNE